MKVDQKYSLKGKLFFTYYFLGLKLLEVPQGSKLNILKVSFSLLSICLQLWKKNTAASGTNFAPRHTSTKKCCAFAMTPKGRGGGKGKP